MPIVRDLYVTDIGHFPETRHHYVDRPEGSDNHILIFCGAGRGWCRFGRRRVQVDPETALFVPAGQPHTYGADEQVPWNIYWLHFNGRRAGDYLRCLGLSAAAPLLFAPAAETLSEAFEDIYRWTETGWSDASLLAMTTSFGRFLALLNTSRRAKGLQAREAQDRILRCIAWLHEHAAGSHTLGELAGQAGLSIPHFSSLFRRHTGCSPMKYLTRLRVQRACALLDHTSLPINAISREVGYDDSFYFCRVFKRIAGVPPSSYRRHIKG